MPAMVEIGEEMSVGRWFFRYLDRQQNAKQSRLFSTKELALHDACSSVPSVDVREVLHLLHALWLNEGRRLSWPNDGIFYSRAT